MRKMGVLQLALYLNSWVAMTTCNSLYFYVMNVIGQVASVATVTIHHMYNVIHCNSIANMLKQLIFKCYATPLQL
jgi:hypothetical protein